MDTVGAQVVAPIQPTAPDIVTSGTIGTGKASGSNRPSKNKVGANTEQEARSQLATHDTAPNLDATTTLSAFHDWFVTASEADLDMWHASQRGRPSSHTPD